MRYGRNFKHHLVCTYTRDEPSGQIIAEAENMWNMLLDAVYQTSSSDSACLNTRMR